MSLKNSNDTIGNRTRAHIVTFVVVKAVAGQDKLTVSQTVTLLPQFTRRHTMAIKNVNIVGRYEVYLTGHLDSNWRGSGHGRADSAANQVAFLN
jgi:hypothetical protein